MDHPLQLGAQTWKPRRDGDLTLHVPAHANFGVPFTFEMDFVPPWLEEEDYESEHRTLHIMVDGYFPVLRNWRNLEGYVLENRDAVETLGEEVTPEVRAPELEIYSSGDGVQSFHTHAKEGWETRLEFLALVPDEPHTFLFELEAFFPSERARQAHFELWMKQLFGKEELADEETARLIEEGWRFRYRGRVCFTHVQCLVPLNVSDPVGWAKKMVIRELGMNELGFCRVNGGELDGSWKPEDGLCAGGRLVLLSHPDECFRQWQQRQQPKPKKSDEES